MNRGRSRSVLLWGLVLGVGTLGMILAPASSGAGAATHHTLPAPVWTNITATLSVSPPARSGAGFAWDAADGYAVLFGGITYPAYSYASVYLNDTWTWNGSWHNITSSAGSAPPARDVHAMMVYDTAAGEVLLFGGDGPGGTGLGDTWAFSAGRWTDLTPALHVAPPARCIASMAYDPSLSGVVLFGGSPSTGFSSFKNDTWLFAHGAWKHLHTSIAPSDRRGAQMTYDPSVKEIVLSGGLNVNGSGISDTWLFNGKSWIPEAYLSPPGQWMADFLFDTHLNAAVQFDGCNLVGCSSADGGIYVFLKGGWSNGTVLYHLTSLPQARDGAAAAYDPNNGLVIMFSGIGFPTPAYSYALNETWTFG